MDLNSKNVFDVEALQNAIKIFREETMPTALNNENATSAKKPLAFYECQGERIIVWKAGNDSKYEVSEILNSETSFSDASVSRTTHALDESENTQCNFCKKNGEPASFYKTHNLKDEKGNITCLILKKHVCELCGATGVNAHTRTYCPVNAKTTSITKMTKGKMANGKFRKY